MKVNVSFSEDSKKVQTCRRLFISCELILWCVLNRGHSGDLNGAPDVMVLCPFPHPMRVSETGRTRGLRHGKAEDLSLFDLRPTYSEQKNVHGEISDPSELVTSTFSNP